MHLNYSDIFVREIPHINIVNIIAIGSLTFGDRFTYYFNLADLPNITVSVFYIYWHKIK